MITNVSAMLYVSMISDPESRVALGVCICHESYRSNVDSTKSDIVVIFDVGDGNTFSRQRFIFSGSAAQMITNISAMLYVSMICDPESRPALEVCICHERYRINVDSTKSDIKVICDMCKALSPDQQLR
jgi:hypothetical protein